MAAIVHIVDDDSSVRGATSFLLTSHGYSTRVYGSGGEFLEQAVLGHGCILLDLRMQDMSGLQLLEELARAGVPTPVIMLTGHGDIATAVQALKLGAVDFIQKPYEEHDLVAAIERALEGGRPDRRRQEAHGAARSLLARLSERETQVLRGLVAGMTNKEMARHLDLSPRTVEMHRSTMMADLGVSSAADAIRIGLEAELAPLGEEAPALAPAVPPVRDRLAPAHAAGPADASLLPSALDLLEGSTDCVLLLDRHFTISFMNRNAIRAVADGEDLVGRQLWSAFPGLRETSAWDQLRHAAEQRLPVSFEVCAPRSGRWFTVNARPIAGGLQVAFRDLTAQRTADVALRQSEERLRLALEASGDGAWEWDMVRGMVRVSRRLAGRLGLGDEPLSIGPAGVWRLIHPADQARLKSRLEDHLAGRTDAFTCEYRLRTRDGDWRWNLDRGGIVARDPVTGAALRMAGTSTDITALQAMKESIAEANERIRLAQEGAGAGLWDYEPGTGSVRLCARSLAMHGLDAGGDGVISLEAWKAAVHPDDVGPLLQAIGEAMHSGGTYSAKYRVVLPDGEVRWIRATGRLASTEGSKVRLVGLNIDETEHERAALNLERLQDDLLNVGRTSAIGTITAALADELNQPLTAISNYVQGLRVALGERVAAPDGGLADVLDETEASARAAAGIVRRIREKAALSRLHRKPEPLSQLIRDAGRIALADGAGATGHELRIDVAPDAERVLVDRVQIQQVVINLIRNAAEATRGRGHRHEIRVEAMVGRKGRVEVRVCDHGPGIPDQVRSRLFSPFATTSADAVGMGLAVCRTIVEAHGGRIWVEPVAGGGTVVAFTLEPVRRHHVPEAAEAPARPARKNPPGRLRPAGPSPMLGARRKLGERTGFDPPKGLSRRFSRPLP
jgi:PAS domain S-box-containing protein